MVGVIKHIFVAALVACSTVSAMRVDAIVIEGNKRIDKATIESYLKIEVGKDHTNDALNDGLKRLYQTNFFADAKLDVKNNKLHIVVVENPLVNRVAIEGNNQIEDKVITPRLDLKPRQVYTLARVKHDAQIIQDLYRLKGYFAAVVTPKVVRKEQNRVDVVFEVKEGKATAIRKIAFNGNRAFGTSKLESVIQTKETRWYRFFTSEDNYDPERLGYDRELLRKFYLEHGYIDFKVTSAIAELTPDHKDFFITFTLDEGGRYAIGDLLARCVIKGVTPEELLKVATFKKGDWYSARRVNDTVIKISNYLGNKGFAFVDVNPEIKKKDGRVVDITFEVSEGPSVYIDQIIIKGNHRTNGDVIRREMLVFEGDPYNAAKIRESERRIKNLGYFKKIEIQREASDQQDKVNLIVDVDEKPSTGEFTFMFGYNTQQGVIGGISAAERNLFGEGKFLGVGLQGGKRSQDITLDYSHPNFTNRPIVAGIRLNMGLEKSVGTVGTHHKGYRNQSLGSEIYMSYELMTDLYQTVTYGISQDKRRNNNQSEVSSFIRAEPSHIVRSYVDQELLWDKTDDRNEPTEGYSISFSNRFYGLGGDANHLRNQCGASFYHPIYEQVILHLNARGGIIAKMGKRVLSADRFTLGGYNFRGFEFDGITVRDKLRPDYSLGGYKYYAGSAEVTMPVPGVPDDLGMKFKTFMDAGTVWDGGYNKTLVHDSSALRLTAGFGLGVRTPMGNIEVTFAWPVRRKSGDESRSFLLKFGN
ncbi:MAG: outer membrane protein assembly factor BamA [Alphaproteobacteria bacterium]|nr:MAG: outer membrane protein assembly factor BamA [Alphaproteobacteria bacterium]